MIWRFHIAPTANGWGNCLEVEAETYPEALAKISANMAAIIEVRLVKVSGTMKVRRSRLLSRDHRAVVTILPFNDGRKLSAMERMKLIFRTTQNIWNQ